MVGPETQVPPAPAEAPAPVDASAPVGAPSPVDASAPAVVPAPTLAEKLPPPASGVFMGTGRRKTSIARVRLIRPGSGKITVNGKPMETHFGRPVYVQHIREPLKVTQMENMVDILVKVEGGGVTGQAGAIRHGVARALLSFSPDYRRLLRKAGCLTRDPRAKERRKCGLKKARKAEQYSKR